MMAVADERDDPGRAQRETRDALANMRLPAGLEDPGRDQALVHDPEAHPSGARGDSRHSVPGTAIPDADASTSARDVESEHVRGAVTPDEQG